MNAGLNVVALYEGLLGLILLFLSYKVVSSRQKFEVGIGDGNHEVLARECALNAYLWRCSRDSKGATCLWA
jgi:uncharacterized membrane protein YecN with MAPEG domain